MKELEPRIKEVGFVLRCPRCRQETLFADGEGSQCLFCRFSADGEGAAEAWVDEFAPFVSPKDRLIEPIIRTCPECASEAMVEIWQVLPEEELPRYFCFSCGTHGSYEDCPRCGELFERDPEGLPTCQHCFDELVASD